MALPQENIKPRFEVHKHEGVYKARVYEMVDEGDTGNKMLQSVEVEREGGFMVYFPSGDSLHVVDESELTRLGFSGEAELVDVTTGDVVPSTKPVSLKRESARKTRQTANIPKEE